ncbi:hypothetical protein MBANPS3_011480 [Mucor bainieri]
MEHQQRPHYTSESSKSPSKGILQKSHDYEQHETPEHKIKWDENKLKATEKQQKEQVLMKVDEPNTPYIRYDPVADKVTNWEDLPEGLRAAHEEPEDFALDGDNVPDTPKKSGIAFANEPDEWQKIDEKEKRDKEEAGKGCWLLISAVYKSSNLVMHIKLENAMKNLKGKEPNITTMLVMCYMKT